jgi:anaphase-promoting complex subunit 1
MFFKIQLLTVPRVGNHAGFLFGLGLAGHLKHLSFSRLFDYMARAHSMTSIGLILGVSATMRASMDSSISKLLSVHIPLLTASPNLEVPPLLQAASVFALGEDSTF